MADFVKTKAELEALIGAIDTRIDYFTDCGTDNIYEISPTTERGSLTEIKKQIDKNMDELMNLVRLRTRFEMMEGKI